MSIFAKVPTAVPWMLPTSCNSEPVLLAESGRSLRTPVTAGVTPDIRISSLLAREDGERPYTQVLHSTPGYFRLHTEHQGM
jgi:hypothetical protein